MQQPTTWSAVAEGYAEEMAAHAALYAEEALRLVGTQPSDHVLYVGTGPGSLAFIAAPRVARVTAVDFSPGMIEQLKARAVRDGIQNIESAVMDAQALEFADSSFDAVCCMFTFMFIPDRALAFREIHRVLRPGGRALVATWAPIDRRPMMKIGFDALVEALPDLPPMPKGDLQDPDECIREMTAAGFGQVTANRFDASIHVPSAEQYVRSMVRAGAPFEMLKKRLGEEGWAKASVRFLGAVRRRIPEGGVDLGAEAILTLGTR